MYLKFTKIDKTPIWINASFIVTVEPSKRNNGSLVVPIGDGLDYEVLESPEQILAMLEGAPEPKVIPVPASNALADSLPENGYDVFKDDGTESKEEIAVEKKAAKKATKTRTRAKSAKSAEQEPEPESEAKVKPVAKKSTKSKAKKKVERILDDEQIERLCKLAPKSRKKLSNTIATQFNLSETNAIIDELVDRGTISLDSERIIWQGTPLPS